MRPLLVPAFVFALSSFAACNTTSAPTEGDGQHTLAPGQCRADADCDVEQSFEYCARPGEGPGCGVCFSGDCGSDQDCVDAMGPGMICSELTGPCVCPQGGGECKAGCALSGCGPAADCGPDDRCVTRTCAVDADCGDPTLVCASGLCKVPGCHVDADCDPPNTLCDTEAYACRRQSCQSDAECGGYCVLGLCYDEPGTCQLPAA